jgi:hypothetical protein
VGTSGAFGIVLFGGTDAAVVAVVVADGVADGIFLAELHSFLHFSMESYCPVESGLHVFNACVITHE